MFGEMSDQRNQPISSMRNTLLTHLNTNINMHSIRRCAFCNRYGHNLNDCCDEGFAFIERDLIHMKRRIIDDSNIPISQKKDELYKHLHTMANSSEIMKHRLLCYAVRYCGASLLDVYLSWTNNICNKIYDMTNDEESQLMNSLLTPDYISFDNEPLNYLIDAENLISSENNDIIQQHTSNRYTSTGLNILSYLAQIRLEELIYSSTNEEGETDGQTSIDTTMHPNDSIHKTQYIECYVNTNLISINNISECPICYEMKASKEFVTTNCNHSFCCMCIKKTVNFCDNKLKCALCRTNIDILTFNDKEICENF